MRVERRLLKRTVLLLAGFALAATGCGGEAGGGDVGDAGWIVSLLDRVPDTEANGHEVALVDVVTAAEAAGVEVPPADAPADDVTGYLFVLPRDTYWPDVLRETATSVDDLRGELGFDHTEVASAVMAGRQPEQYVVLQGGFDAAAIDDAVRSEPVWSDLLATAEHGGVSYYTWGEDFTSVMERRSAVRRLARGGRLALDDGYLYWVPWTAGIEALIDAGAGTVPTLADRPLLRQAAEVLQREQVYSAILTDTPIAAEPFGAGSGEAVTGSLAPYLVLGLGGGLDDAGAFWVVVAIHDTAAAAEQSAAAFRSVIAEGTAAGSGGTLWSELVSTTEVTVEGETMVAVLHTERPPGDWIRAYLTRDPLLAVADS